MRLVEFTQTFIQDLPTSIRPDFKKQMLFYITDEAISYSISNIQVEEFTYTNQLSISLVKQRNKTQSYERLNYLSEEYGLPFSIFKSGHSINATTINGESVSEFPKANRVIELMNLFRNSLEVVKLKISKHSEDDKCIQYILHV